MVYGKSNIEGIESLGIKRTEGYLSNGSKLIVYEKKDAPVCIRASVFCGSRFDPTKKEGLSHFSEHMVVAGTEKFSTKDKLAVHIEKYGGSVSASTGPEVLSINTEVGDPKDYPVAVEVMQEVLSRPLFENKTVETEREAILKELGSKKSNPGEMVWDVYRELFFQGTAMGHSNLGSEQSIKAITRQDIVDFHRHSFVSGKVAISVAGGVSFSQAQAFAEEKLSLPISYEVTLLNNLPVVRGVPIRIKKYDGIDQVHLVFGYRAAPRHHSDISTLSVIAEVLGGGRASSLSRKLRLERGLVYGVNAWNLTYSDSGSLVIKTSTVKNKLNEVLAVISGEVARVRKVGLSQDEVEFAQNKIINSCRMNLQTTRSIVDWHATDDLTGTDPNALKKYLDNISRITPDKTRVVAQTYLTENQWYLGLCGDIGVEDIDEII